ncbi:xyloglucan endotransglucosylase protein 7 [Physcomitrium patens]|uniref:Xyloglucan endotransglucosylase/hydrolase n=1 Tax=Physcomitrium patens TaxID=3218 RepID=A0A2K1IJG0_PHYPA|nr:xyloglucan endotransglucosylase/hydrolase protein 9-like [Physcomitrium patens]XP_024361942.1 xyloglucan endotransglucosylase/hydrolase protein 9-like [Physcomitrium patens]PNR29413.1 hypothetical protein PHYPA_028106 [Physcomitrium patens]PNR29414.1 hypothetical protein PHYPA_028107 [Physcomitrium patens]|eukprot:XP_024361937.1 xyloglucan endotransglucosylase/hydrolase protein 9-like [Physcomitrella patens]
MGSVRGSSGWVAAAVMLWLVAGVAARADSIKDFKQWSPQQTEMYPNRTGVKLILKDPKASYTGMASPLQYTYAANGAYIKMPPGDSAGVVSTFYMASSGPKHCEFDFEFLGNKPGMPYLLHTNIFVDGVGGREQQIRLWFDPRKEAHFYNFQWNKDLLVFYIDSMPVRMFKNLENEIPGFKYPKKCAMGVYLSVWDGSSWATDGGRVKLDWASAPFVTTYDRFKLAGCVAKNGDAASIEKCQTSFAAAPGDHVQKMGQTKTRQLREVKAKYLHYNYCDDRKRYPVAPRECAYNVL